MKAFYLKSFYFALALMFSASAIAFDFGNVMKNLNAQDIQTALSVTQKITEANKEISEPQEIEMGNGIATNLLGAAPLVKDEALQKYVNRVGLWLAMQS